MLIVASQVFDSDFSNRIVHMARPSIPHLQLLFTEAPALDYILVTDCLAPLFQFDIRRIESERTEDKLLTHIEGTFCVHRSMFETFRTGNPSSAPSWSELLTTYTRD